MPIDRNDPQLLGLYNQMYGQTPMGVLQGINTPAPAPVQAPSPTPGSVVVAPAPKGSALAPGVSFDDLAAGRLAPPPPAAPPSPPAPIKGSFATPAAPTGAPSADQPLLTSVNLPKPQTVTSKARYEDLGGPELRRMMGDAEKAQGEAGEQQLGADLSKSLAKAQTAEDLAALYNQRADQDVAQEKRRQSTLDSYMGQQQQLMDDVRSAKVDPDRLFASRGTAGNVMGMLAAVLSGYLAGWRGGENEYLKHLDAAINRDIAAQQEAINGKKTALAEGKNLFAQKMQQFGDERVAHAAAKADLISAIQAKGEQLAASADTEQARSNWAKFNAALQQQKAENFAKINRWTPAQSQTVGGVDYNAVTKRAQAISDKAAELGQNITPQQARARALSEMGYGTYNGPGYAKMDAKAAEATAGDPFAGLGAPKATAWKPWRSLDGNAAHDAVLEQRAVNVGIATALGGGKFTPKAQAAAEKSGLLIEPGDDQDEVDRKIKLAKQLAAKGAFKPETDVSNLVDVDE
ncbi:MAG: hypothetical protein EBR82_12175 [Caulobacteraceae bacterium]|nr:hypothetical protein [Caulobacteraceae bacterium]